MSDQLTPDISAQTSVHPREKRSITVPTPAFGRARRALIRFRAAQITRGMIRELLAIQQEPVRRRRRRDPLFVRLDALAVHYEALGGDPADLLR
jgi:hypothetical protein